MHRPRTIAASLLSASSRYTSRFRSVASLYEGYQRRNQSTTNPPGPSSHFWGTGRVILLTAFTASLTYVAGVADFSSHIREEKVVATSSVYVYAGEVDLQKAIDDLKNSLGDEAVSTDEDDLERHGFSEWSTTNAEKMPSAIVYPKSTEEVCLIAKVCNHYKVPICAFSAGSSLEGNFSSPHGGINVDFSNMSKILAFHPEDMDVVVQPGVRWMSLNEQIKSEGLFFPVDPGPTAMIGGMVGTGGSGTNAVRYGTMREWVINLTVVLADGTVIKTRRRPRKSSAGYNLTNLFVGSEGTLGLVTEITLKLAPIPQETSVAVVTFPTIRDAAAAASNVMRAGIPIAAMEVMDDSQMRIINASGSTGKKWEEMPTIFFKFSGTNVGVQDNIDFVKRIAKASNCGDFHFATDEKSKNDLWSARKEALWSFLAMRQDDSEALWATDVAVPFSRLPDLIEVTKRDLDATGLFGAAIGHIGDGNFHTSILYKPSDPLAREKVDHFVHRMVDRALELEGTCTGEHGVGIGKKKELIDELGLDTVNTMKTIKRALDPNLILNPGKIFDF